MKLVAELEQLFFLYADEQTAIKQEKYMRNQFHFFGIPKPLRARLEKQLFKIHALTLADLASVIDILWQKNEREFQYAACELAYYHRNLWNTSMLPIFERMIREKSWWDIVDYIAVHLIGRLVFEHQELNTIMDAWIEDDYLWIRRAALLFQLRWKKNTNEPRLLRYCMNTMHDKHFFIRKAIGWVLREYSKTDARQIRMFIQEQRSFLSALSIKEASKYL